MQLTAHKKVSYFPVDNNQWENYIFYEIMANVKFENILLLKMLSNKHWSKNLQFRKNQLKTKLRMVDKNIAN